ncbi:YgjV family protein [Candidatus Saccharibacteria bacterium]|nr:YgjV family protein [Candidatus Saccharibacteria bacterium]
MTEIVAQIAGLIASAISIGGIQLKKKRHILIAFIAANAFYCIDFLLIGAWSGLLVSLISIIQTLVVYGYDKHKKPITKTLIVVFILISLATGVFSVRQFVDLLPLLAFALYSLSIVQKKGKNLRILTLILIICWMVYDSSVGAYSLLISDTFFTVSTLVAIIRYDILKIKKTKKKP